MTATRDSSAVFAVGLEDRGEIAPGLLADFIRVSLFGNIPVVREVYCGGAMVA